MFKEIGWLAIGIVATFGAEANAAYWMDAAVCDDGKVIVQIDAGERRSVQLIVNDDSIKSYFAHELTTPQPDDNGFYRNTYQYFDRNPNGTPRLDGPMVVHGWTYDGVFRIEQFRGFHQGPDIHTSGVVTCGPYSGGCGDTGPAVDVARYGDGLNVEIWRPRFYGQYCVAQDSYSMQCTQYSQVGGYEAREIANWWFPRCDMRQLLP